MTTCAIAELRPLTRGPGELEASMRNRASARRAGAIRVALFFLTFAEAPQLFGAEASPKIAFERSPTRLDTTQLRGGSGAYAAPRAGGKRHSGVDIVANQSSIDRSAYEVYAVHAGKIAYARTNESEDGGYGYTLVIDHGDGFYTLYAHLARFASAGLPPPKVGDPVRAGDRIGYIADLSSGELSSGNAKAKSVASADKIQLHLEVFTAPPGRDSTESLESVKKGGSSVDPTPALQAAGYR